MKAVLGRGLLAVVLFVAGWVCWSAGQLERRLTDANRELATLRYDGPVIEYDDIEQSVSYVGRLPWLATSLMGNLSHQRATAEYWRANYAALAPTPTADSDATEQDPGLLFFAANAAFREAERRTADRQTTVQTLERILTNYAEVLTRAPDHLDAAYNYEYVARVRNNIAKGREAPPKLEQNAATAAQGNLPTGATLHGRPGTPPPDTNMKLFKMLVPLRPDERESDPTEAGGGQEKVRRG